MQFGAVRLTGFVAVLIAAAAVWIGVLGNQPAAAQQGFGNIFGYDTQQRQRRRGARRSRQPAGEEKATQADAAKSTAKKGKEEEERAFRAHLCGDLARRPAHLRLRRDRADRPLARLHAAARARHPAGRLQRHRQEPIPPFEYIQWRSDAVDAAHHMVGCCHACRCCTWISRIARLHPPALLVRAAVVEHDQDGCARDRRSARHHAGCDLAFLPAAAQDADRSVDSRRPRCPPPAPTSSSRASSTPATTAAVSPQAAKPLNPIDYAAALKERATADKAAAEKTMQETLAAAQAAGAEARLAVDDVRKTQADLAAVEAKLAELDAAQRRRPPTRRKPPHRHRRRLPIRPPIRPRPRPPRRHAPRSSRSRRAPAPPSTQPPLARPPRRRQPSPRWRCGRMPSPPATRQPRR